MGNINSLFTTNPSEILPVDVFIPGCPPRPEALIDAMIKLREKIQHPDVAVKVKNDD